MADSGSSFPLFGWVYFAVGVFFVFERIETIASHELKLRVMRWLKNADPAGTASGWLSTFVGLFDRVFGEKHFSWKCFRRSCAASVGAVLVVTTYWVVSRPTEAVAAFTAGQQGHGVEAFFILTIVLSLVPDYLSLLKSRRLIGWMNRKRSLTRFWVGVFADLILTLIIVCVAQFSSLMLRQVLVYGLDSLRLGFMWRLNIFLAGVFTFSSFYSLPAPPGLLALWIWPWATLFTAIWALLYGVAGALFKLARLAGLGLSAVRWAVNIDEKPIAAVGVVAAGVVTVVGPLLSLIPSNRGGSIRFGLDLQQFLVLTVMLSLIGGAAYASIKLETYLSRYYSQGVAPKGFGGWLVLVGLGVFISPLTLLWWSYSDLYPALVRIDWHAMSQKQFAIGLLRVLLVVVVWLGCVVWAVYNALLFAKKRTSFPKAWIGFNGLLLIIYIVGAVFDPNVRQFVVGVAFWSAVWIGYMLRSQRVKNTFVR